jgi:outer membrane protein insertion porin family
MRFGTALRREGFFLCVLGVLCGGELHLHAAVQDFVGRPVAAVRLSIEGRDTTDAALTQVVETPVGEPLSMIQVRASLAHLFSLGRFEDVRVEATLDAGRVTLRYVLVPIHPIARIRFVGAGAPGVDEGALRRALTDRFGATPPLGRLTAMTRLLEDALRERGYRHPSIQPRSELEHAPERATLVFTIDTGPRTTIGTVKIDGRTTVSQSEFLSRLAVTPGAPYQPDALATRIEKYIENRRASGYYEAKVVPTVQFSDSDRVADLVLTVTPGPRVRVVFAGDPLPSEKRAELVPVEREGSIDEDLLEDSSNRIEEALRAQGYRAAKAPHTREQKNDELVITFTVTRGQQYRVASLEITGNTSIPLSDFEAALRLHDGQPFAEANLDADVSLIEEIYHRRGFATARALPAIDIVTPTPAPAQVPVAVRIQVNEGVRTIVDSLSFAGNAALGESALRARIRLQPGAPYVPGQLAVDRDAIQIAYQDLGYESASVEARPLFTQNDTHVDVRFDITEGPRLFVDHVMIIGNVRTSTSTIEHELQLKAGDPLSVGALNETQRRLTSLGLFRRVQITELPHGGAATRDVIVTVEEAAATTIDYGLGAEGRLQEVQGDNGVATQRFDVAPRAFFGIGRRNLFGKNRSINLFNSVSVHLLDTKNATTASSNPIEYRVLGTYREPRLFNTTADGLLTATAEQQIRSSFSFDRLAATAQVARRVTRALSVTGSYQLQRTALFDVDVKTDPSIGPLINRLFSSVPLRLSSFSSAVIHDTRDDPVNPTVGHYLSVNGQLAALAIGSEVGFAKSFVTAQGFKTVAGSSGIVLAGNARLGMAEEFDTQNPIPEPERFFAGGDTTVRGFALDTLGIRHDPADPQRDTIDKNGFPIGGNATVILMGEVRVPVRGGVSVVGFFDTGNVFQRLNQLDVTQLRSAVGFGVRYKSPFGPLRLDLGFKTHVESIPCATADATTPCFESRPALHISFGQAF